MIQYLSPRTEPYHKLCFRKKKKLHRMPITFIKDHSLTMPTVYNAHVNNCLQLFTTTTSCNTVKHYKKSMI